MAHTTSKKSTYKTMASRLSVRTLTHAGRAVSNLPRVTCLPTPTRASQFSSVSSARVSQYARLQSIANQRTFASSARMVSSSMLGVCAGKRKRIFGTMLTRIYHGRLPTLVLKPTLLARSRFVRRGQCMFGQTINGGMLYRSPMTSTGVPRLSGTS